MTHGRDILLSAIDTLRRRQDDAAEELLKVTNRAVVLRGVISDDERLADELQADLDVLDRVDAGQGRDEPDGDDREPGDDGA